MPVTAAYLYQDSWQQDIGGAGSSPITISFTIPPLTVSPNAHALFLGCRVDTGGTGSDSGAVYLSDGGDLLPGMDTLYLGGVTAGDFRDWLIGSHRQGSEFATALADGAKVQFVMTAHNEIFNTAPYTNAGAFQFLVLDFDEPYFWGSDFGGVGGEGVVMMSQGLSGNDFNETYAHLDAGGSIPPIDPTKWVLVSQMETFGRSTLNSVTPSPWVIQNQINSPNFGPGGGHLNTVLAQEPDMDGSFTRAYDGTAFGGPGSWVGWREQLHAFYVRQPPIGRQRVRAQLIG